MVVRIVRVVVMSNQFDAATVVDVHQKYVLHNDIVLNQPKINTSTNMLLSTLNYNRYYNALVK